METKFQTSFIPKKPLMPQESSRVHAPASILMIIGVIVFTVSLAAAAFTFFAKGYLEKAQEQYKVNLADNEKRFNLPLIEELKKANTKIDLANQLLKNHLAVSEALNILGALTAEKIRFASFEFSATDSSKAALTKVPSNYRIKMKGVADSFNSVAFQSDVFSRSQKYGTNKVLRNPVLSDLSVDKEGLVTFFFSADLSLPDISYEKLL